MESVGIAPPFNLDTGCRWVASFTPWPLYSWGNSPGTQWTGGLLASRSDLEVTKERKISCFCRKSNIFKVSTGTLKASRSCSFSFRLLQADDCPLCQPETGTGRLI
jgi:hypothetical protein